MKTDLSPKWANLTHNLAAIQNEEKRRRLGFSGLEWGFSPTNKTTKSAGFSPGPSLSLPNRTFSAACIVAIVLIFATPPAFAVNKDMVELQTQVKELQDAVARLQQSNDERMGVLKDLVQQGADSVNKMSLLVDALQQQVHGQQEGLTGKLDQVSGQVQSLNDSLDEVRTRLNNVEKALQSVQNQQQSINAALQNLTPNPTGSSTPGPDGTSGPGQAGMTAGVPQVGMQQPQMQQPAPVVKAAGGPSTYVPFATVQGPPIATAIVPGAPPARDLYKTALTDYMAARYPMASTEFESVVKTYPDDPLAGNAYFYMGEIDRQANKFSTAVKDYDHVLDQFPDSTKTAVSHLHKGEALIAMKQNSAGVNELRALITRFPNSPEAAQARSKLNGMGVAIVPRAQPRPE